MNYRDELEEWVKNIEIKSKEDIDGLLISVVVLFVLVVFLTIGVYRAHSRLSVIEKELYISRS